MIRALQQTDSGLRSYTSGDFDHSPLVAFYEVTRACDLLCRHCRACAQSEPHAAELDTRAAFRLIAEFASFPKPPLLVLTGGDPFKRPDLEELVAEADEAGLEVALTPSATPLVTRRALQVLTWSGLHRLAISLDGARAASHDDLRGVRGSFQRTLEILEDARALGLELQVNTTITSANVDEVDEIAALLGPKGIVLWSVFFLVPVGRATNVARISPQQYEAVFERLWWHARHQPFRIKTTEAPHYRRFVAERSADPRGAEHRRSSAASGGAPVGVNDGKGVMFVSHTGVISPSGFLPIPCGLFPHDSVIEVYQHHPLFRYLRLPNLLAGKCGACPYRFICGGSRARAYAVTGDPLAAEPDCTYLPPGWKERSATDDSAAQSDLNPRSKETR